LRNFKIIMVSALVSAIVTAGGIWYYDHHFATKIAVIDMTGYVAGLKKVYLAGKLPKEELDARLKLLGRQINDTHSSNTVLVLKEVVVSGKVKDFTPEVLAENSGLSGGSSTKSEASR
jgi:hypothetical protein